MTRSFLSLQVVESRLPSVLKDMQRMTSVWQSIILTGSPMSRFQMRTWRETRKDYVNPHLEKKNFNAKAPSPIHLCKTASGNVQPDCNPQRTASSPMSTLVSFEPNSRIRPRERQLRRPAQAVLMRRRQAHQADFISLAFVLYEER